MMKYTLYSVFTAALLIGTLVNTAAQTASVTAGCAPLLVEFTPPAGVNAFFWNFDNNNNSSTLSNPTETFVDPGTYVVEFSLGSGLPVLGSVTITVYPKPDLDLVADPTGGCAPLPVQFSSNSQVDQAILDGGVSWNWTFGDGTSAQTETASHTYAAEGNYNVSLQLISGISNCSTVETVPALVSVSSVDASFTTDPSPASSCDAPLTVSFINTTVGDDLTFEWEFGDGQTTLDANPGPVTYNLEGDFDIMLTVTDANGCTNTETQTVSVGRPTADFSVPDTVCLGQPIQLVNNSSAGNYSWTLGADSDPNFSTEASPEVTFNVEGDQEITLAVTSPDGNCANTVSKTVFVQNVDGSFTTDPSFLCSDPFEFTYTPATLDPNGAYSWLFSDSTTSSEMMPTYMVPVDTNQYAETGVREIMTQLAFTSSAGCTTTFTRTDTVFQAYALFMPDVDNGCAPLTVTFSDSSAAYTDIVSYTYIYGDGQTATFNNDDDHAYTFTEAGEFDVRLVIEDANGCRDTSYAVRIDVGEPIMADFTVDKQDVCPGEEVTLTTTTQDDRIDAWHFDTDDGRSSHCYNEPNLTWSFISEADQMDVTLTVEYNGCYNEITKQNFINVQGPIANLYYEMDCEAPLEYTFRDSSYNATTVTWDFGDGSPMETGTDLTHTYAETGDYWVKLTAENPGTGCAVSVDSALVCVRMPQATFELDPMICIGTQVDLDGSMSTDVNAECWKGYTWYFEISGRPITTQDSSIEFSFSNPGMETVMLEVEDVNGCKDTATVMTQIYDIQANFELDNSLICVPGTVNFTDMSMGDTTITKWEWMFGDGVGMSSSQNPSYTYNNLAGVPPGEGISVTLSIEDELGCTAEASQTISVYTPQSNISASDLTICAGDEVTFEASDFFLNGEMSPLSYSWDFGNGQSSMEQQASTTYDAGGSYTVTLNYTEDATGCVNQNQVTVQVQDYPTEDFIYVSDEITNPDNVCREESVVFSYNGDITQPLTYQWSVNGNNVSVPTPEFVFSDNGPVDYNITVSTTFGCETSGNGSFNVVGPAGEITASARDICIGDAVTFELSDTSDLVSWTWTFGDGGSAMNESPVTHVYDSEDVVGELSVALTMVGENACTITTTQPISVGGGTLDLPNILACGGDQVPLNPGEDPFPNATYSWAPAEFLDNATAANPIAIVNSSTTFTATITSQNGCITMASVTVDVIPLVNFAGQNIVVCDDGAVTLPEPDNPNGLYTFEWTPEGPNVTLEENEDTKTVNLRVRDGAGCNDNNVFEFNIAKATASFMIPNSFTPNGDELNDEFRIYSVEGATLNITTFKVFNRWGKVVYDGSGASNPSWNGDVDGTASPSDVYTYIIEIEVPQCEAPIQEKGDVSLIR